VEASGLAHPHKGVFARRRMRRPLEVAASGAALIAVAILAALAVTLLAGYRPLIVRSGSMEPAVRTGDLIVTKRVHPTAVDRGQVVTFHDPSRDRELLTHRVVRVRERAGRLYFVTRGRREHRGRTLVGRGGRNGRAAHAPDTQAGLRGRGLHHSGGPLRFHLARQCRAWRAADSAYLGRSRVSHAQTGPSGCRRRASRRLRRTHRRGVSRADLGRG
jgi:signal peptidase I